MLVVERAWVALDMSKYEEIRRQTSDFDWSKQIVEGASIADLDEKAIKEAREGYKEHYPNQKKEADTWSDEGISEQSEADHRRQNYQCSYTIAW